MNINNLKNIDFKKILNTVKTNFDKDAALFLLVLGLIIFFGIKQLVQPAFSQLGENLNKVNQKRDELKQYQEREKYTASPQSQQTQQNLPIQIYKAPYPGMDAESASVELVQEVIQIIKETGNNRINQVDFTTQELKDDAGTNSSEYSILSLNLSLEGSYESIQNMLNEIYLMNYLVAIKKISSIPLESFNYEVLKTDLTLDLYVKLGGSQDDSANGEPANIAGRRLHGLRMNQEQNNIPPGPPAPTPN